MTKSFRKFMEEGSGASPLMSSLEDMLGIDSEDLKKEPQLATFFKISQGTNLGSYKILEFKRDSQGKITHAVVEPMTADKVYGEKDGSFRKIQKGPLNSKPQLVAIADLDKLLGQDFSASQAQMP